MAAVCDICAKKPGFGNNRPWSRKITKRRFNPNIQRVRATVNGTPKRLNVCTGCLKAGKVVPLTDLHLTRLSIEAPVALRRGLRRSHRTCHGRVVGSESGAQKCVQPVGPS